MAVTYLEGGDSPSADVWNSGVFGELERKVALALDNKSFLLASDALFRLNAALVGKKFFFTNGTRNVTAGMAANYDHSAFTNAVASAVEVSRDETLGIMVIDPLPVNLHDSLQAHTKDGYYLKGEGAFDFPEKRYKYAVAELIYEGPGFQTVVFPRTYDKYNFFRIHNLNAYAMTFHFEKTGSYETFTVPALGSRTVRRTGVDGSYNGDWNYFWKAQSGDPRFFKCLFPTNAEVAGTANANNVTNPAMVYLWASAFHGLFGVGGAKWYFDPHVYNDISGYYCPDYFPDPDDTTQPMGNFFHHKGIVEIAGAGRFNFRGYQTLQSDIPALGVQNMMEDQLTVRPQGAAAIYTSNLFNQWDEVRPTLTAGINAQLDTTNSSSHNFVQHDTVAVEVTIGGVTLNQERFRFRIGLTTNFAFHRDTLANVLSLNYWGESDYNATSQETDCLSISNRSLKLTPFGPRIIFETHTSLDGSWWAHATLGFRDIFEDIYATPSGTGLTRKCAVQFHGYGFPTPAVEFFDLLDIYLPVIYDEPAFLSPRKPRAYSRANQGHPNIQNYYENSNGDDFTLLPISYDYEETPWAFMTALALGTGQSAIDTDVREWVNPDQLWGGMPRVPLLREHYNAMAMLLNSVRRIVPLMARHDLESNLKVLCYARNENETTEGLYLPAPNYNGITGSNVCPRDMYCSFAEGSESERVFQRLGVPILTHLDFPDDYHDALAASGSAVTLYTDVEDTYVSRVTPGSTEWNVEKKVVGSGRIVGNSGSIFSSVPTFRWVRIQDVKSAVESFGWKFVYAGGFYPLKLELYSISEAQLHGPPGGVYHYTLVTPMVSTGTVVQSRAASGYTDKVALWIEDGEGEWKLGPAATTVYDAIPNDIAKVSHYISGFDKYVVHELTGFDEAGRRAFGVYDRTLGGVGRQFKYALIQQYYSSGLTESSVAFRIPIGWFTYQNKDYGREGYEEAISSGSPPEAIERSGATTYSLLTNGDTVFGHESAKAIEVVPMIQIYVEAES